jgi:hypothetical protein
MWGWRPVAGRWAVAAVAGPWPMAGWAVAAGAGRWGMADGRMSLPPPAWAARCAYALLVRLCRQTSFKPRPVRRERGSL